MQKIIQQGVFAPADLQNGFCRRSMQLANLWRVKCTWAGQIVILQNCKGKGNSQRITLDLRNVNNCMAADPKITLPNYKNLGRQFANCFCSSFDLCSMYFAIPINYNCMHTQDQILVFRASLQNAKASHGP